MRGHSRTILSLVICILLVCYVDWPVIHRLRPKHVIRSSLQREYDFYRANDPRFEYMGRWVQSQVDNATMKGLQGSSVAFAVFQQDEIIIALSETSIRKGILSSHTGSPEDFVASTMKTNAHEFRVNIKARDSTMIGLQSYHTDLGLIRVRSRATAQGHTMVQIEFYQAGQGQPIPTAFQGIWLRRGSSLQQQKKESAKNRNRRVNVEFVTSLLTPRVKHESFTESGPPNSTGDTFIHHLRHGTENVFSSSVSLPIGTCVTPKCQYPSQRTSDNRSVPTLADSYFDPNGDTLSGIATPWARLYINAPSMIVIEAGFWDFLSFSSYSSHHTQHAIDQFTAHFTASFVKYILTLRRNLPKSTDKSIHQVDESYLYNSLPSEVPIFLMMPPLPSTYDPLLQSALSIALHKVITILRRVEGDTRTIFIDTSGWLDSDDFTYVRVDLGHQAKTHTNTKSNTKTNMNTKLNVRQIPLPNTHGHKKMAHFISLHLCPYLVSANRSNISALGDGEEEDDGEECIFDKHDSYRGTMYLPDQANMQMMLEEKKIARIKAMLNGN